MKLLSLLLLLPLPALADPVTVALDWTPNTNHIGLYVAQAQGLYDAAGLQVDILPYADTSAGTLVANGVADFGVLSALGLFSQRTAGADLVATYAVVQHETGRLVFDGTRSDITSPRDLDGKIYAGFGSAWEKALIGAMIRQDGGTGTFEIVTLGTSAYEALAAGSVDFTLEVHTWEGVRARLDGRPQGAFRYADYGVPDQHTTFIGSSGAWLEANPEAARAFLAATRQGYAFAVENPDAAVDMLLAGTDGLLTDRAFVRASLQALIDGQYLRGPNGETGTISDAKMAEIGAYLHRAGVLKDADGHIPAAAPDVSAYYSNAYLPG